MTNDKEDRKPMTEEEIKKMREVAETATSYSDAKSFKRLVAKMDQEKKEQK
ncbi:hypothetical protein [Nioella nitratireducens]|uniref:hypothetical protein n=1 Tax=Nioella nitratireducens TaxID=1287720 RepID=UPI0013143E9B|nr:hypothetical protein [Nioella nitratireducens]